MDRGRQWFVEISFWADTQSEGLITGESYLRVEVGGMGQGDIPHLLHADDALIYCGAIDAQLKIKRGIIAGLKQF